MKSFNIYIFLLLATLFGTSCENDGDRVVLSGFEEAELKATATDVVLSNSNSGVLVFSLMWDAGELRNTYSERFGLAENTLVTTLQFSTQNTFSGVKEVVETSSSKSYTGKALNALALSIGLEIGKADTIYIRLKSSIAANTESLFSNVIELTVTPYEEIAFLYMPGDLSGGWEKYTVKLCSRAGNGEYEGFVEATQWDDFKFTTEQSSTSGITYGSVPDELYRLDDSPNQWNIWFEEGGYFLLKANTNTMMWSKTTITGFYVTGEFNGWSQTANPMTYDSATKLWTVTCNITTTLYGIQILANGDWAMAYGDENRNGELTLGGANIVINEPGTYIITMDLSNPEKYTYTIK